MIALMYLSLCPFFWHWNNVKNILCFHSSIPSSIQTDVLAAKVIKLKQVIFFFQRHPGAFHLASIGSLKRIVSNLIRVHFTLPRYSFFSLSLQVPIYFKSKNSKIRCFLDATAFVFILLYYNIHNCSLYKKKTIYSIPFTIVVCNITTLCLRLSQLKIK